VELPPYRPCSGLRAAEYDTAFMVCVTAPAFDAAMAWFRAEAEGLPVQLGLVLAGRSTGKTVRRSRAPLTSSSIAAAIASSKAISEVNLPMRAETLVPGRADNATRSRSLWRTERDLGFSGCRCDTLNESEAIIAAAHAVRRRSRHDCGYRCIGSRMRRIESRRIELLPTLHVGRFTGLSPG
jgi:hypothetical protein